MAKPKRPVKATPGQVVRPPLSVNDKIVDRAVRHAVHLERVKTGEANKIVRLLDDEVFRDLNAQLVARLANIKTRGFDTGKHTTRRLRDLLKATRGTVVGGMLVVSKKVRESLNELAGIEADFQVKILQNVLPAGIEFSVVQPSPSMLRSAVSSRPFRGQLLGGWFGELGRQTQRSLERQLTVGLAQGETMPALMRRVRGVNGLQDLTKRHATAITRTAVTHVSAQAREITYAENDELVKGVQYVATLDSRTTEICASLDGKIFPTGQGPRPPQHFQCRSTTVPALKSFEELGFGKIDLPPSTRASMDGQVSAKLLYPDWLQRQTKSVQQDVLGKGKAEMFRRGALDISKFNGTGNRPLTLSQLKERIVP